MRTDSTLRRAVLVGEKEHTDCSYCGAPMVRSLHMHRVSRYPQPPFCRDVCRFWSHVGLAGQSECWPWLGSKRPKGYGQLFWRGQNARKAHRIAFFLTFGYWPRNVLHRCDNPGCCNPTHLEDGTIRQNNRQMWARGRHWLQRPGARPRGVVHGHAKLADADVLEVRRAYAAGEGSQYELADRYGVRQRTIWGVVNGRTWRHLVSGAVAPEAHRRRAVEGEGNPAAKLTTEAVLAIRASDEPGSVVARRYGVSHTMVIRIRRRLAWQHVP